RRASRPGGAGRAAGRDPRRRLLPARLQAGGRRTRHVPAQFPGLWPGRGGMSGLRGRREAHRPKRALHLLLPFLPEMTVMKTLLRALLLVFVLAGPAAAQPALWRVADADTEIVL